MYHWPGRKLICACPQHLVIHRLGQCSQCCSRILDVGIHLVLTYLAVSQHDVAAAVLCNLGIVSHKDDGSSLAVTAGLLTNARAMATRCICPPDI